MSEKLHPGGQTFSAESYHHWAKSKFLGCVEHTLPNGATLILPNSSADLDTAAFNEFMTALEAYANEHGVFLEDMESAA